MKQCAGTKKSWNENQLPRPSAQTKTLLCAYTTIYHTEGFVRTMAFNQFQNKRNAIEWVAKSGYEGWSVQYHSHVLSSWTMLRHIIWWARRAKNTPMQWLFYLVSSFPGPLVSAEGEQFSFYFQLMNVCLCLSVCVYQEHSLEYMWLFFFYSGSLCLKMPFVFLFYYFSSRLILYLSSEPI